MDLAWKCHLCPKRICEVSNRDPALHAALQELSQRSWCWHRDAKKGFSSKTHQNRPAPPTVLPRAGPALRSQCQSEIQSKINLLVFIIFFPLESIYQKSPTKNQRLCRGSGKLRCGDWAAKEQGGVRVCYPMLEWTAWVPFPFSPAEEDDCVNARGMRWKQLWSQCSSSFRFSWMLSSVQGRRARDVSVLYGWPLGCYFAIVCYFWHPIFGLCTIIYRLWEQIKYKRHVHKMDNVKGTLCCTSNFIFISLNFKLVHVFLSIGMWKKK